MSVTAVATDRGRKESPMRTDHFLPRRFSSRERSPHIVMDKLTRYRSPSRDRDSDNECGEVTPSRIPQPYRTSFSAVTSLTSSAHKTSPCAKHTVYNVGTFPRRGLRATLPDKMKYNYTGNSSGSSPRSGSHDLLSSATRTVQSEDPLQCHVTPERAASCDLLDSPAHSFTPNSDDSIREVRSSPFDNRRLNPTYSSTPTRFHMNHKSPVMKSIESKRQYSRNDSNISSITVDSVFMPDSPQPTSLKDANNANCEMSKPPDSGFVEGEVEVRVLIEKQYDLDRVFVPSYLKKLKKKGALPEPNEETAELVKEMREEHQAKCNKSQSVQCTPEDDGRSGRSRWRSTLNKKAQSITSFLRRLQNSSPKSNGKPEKKGRRSKSAGRLEGNRVVGAGSNSSFGAVPYETSYEIPSTSSDQSSSAFQTSTASEPIRSSDTDLKQSFDQSGAKVQVLVIDSPPESAKHNIASNSTRRILKSLEDNVGTDNSVYRTFKQKQSPGYRRHAEAISMRAQALKAVEIPLHSATKQSGSGSRLECSGGDGCGEFDRGDLSRIATDDTIGDCSLDIHNTGSEHSVSGRQNGLSNSADASRITLNSKDLPMSPPNVSNNASSQEHLQNGDATVHEQPKTPSYVKLSCAVSGYKPYGKQHTTTMSVNSPKENGVQIALDNNNSVINGGEPVTLEYTPSKTAYVKKVSERFEQNLSSNPSKPADDNNGCSVNSQTANNHSSGQIDTDAFVHLKHTGLPVTHASSEQYVHHSDELSNTLRESKTGWRSTNKSDALLKSTQPSDNVNSENINFSQAKLAFVHDKDTSQGDCPNNGKGSAVDKSLKSHKPVLPVEHVITHSSQILLDTDIDNRADCDQDISSRDFDVTDNDVTSQQVAMVTDSISSSKLRAESIQDHEHLSVNCITHSDTVENDTTQWNGAVVNGLDPVLEATGSSCHSSFDSLAPKDADHFVNAMSLEEERLLELCDVAEKDLQSAVMSEEVSGKVRAAIGKAHLLTSKKFKQFKGLCDRNMTQESDEDFQTTCQDLAGFWDMVLIQVHDVYHLFDELDKLRHNDWRIASNKTSPLLSKSIAKAPGTGKRSARTATPKSAKAAEAAKAREEARKKLFEVKKAGRRQRKTSEKDDIEIKIVTSNTKII